MNEEKTPMIHNACGQLASKHPRCRRCEIFLCENSFEIEHEDSGYCSGCHEYLSEDK